MTVIAVSILVALFVLGVPIWASLAVGAVILMSQVINLPSTNMPLVFFNGIDSFTLAAITFFLFAGTIMAYCGPSKYIFEFVNSFFGRKRGGLPITAVVMSMIYAAITGSSTATLAGVAELCRPEMLKKGYSAEFTASLLAASCTLGQMIPPSILMILYGNMVGANTGTLFIAGIIPGIISGIVLCMMAWVLSPKLDKSAAIEHPEIYTAKYRTSSTIKAFPALFMPVAVLGAIYSGVVTATEAGALAAVYGILISALYRGLNVTSFRRTLISVVRNNAMIYILIAGALLLANPITYMQIPQKISELIAGLGLGPVGFMFACSVLFIVLGMFLDVIPILYLTIPVIYPALIALNVNLIQFNIVLILCLQIGQMSPPFGTALYIASGVCDAPINKVAKGVIKYLVAYTLVTFLMILVPQFSTFLPNLMGLR